MLARSSSSTRKLAKVIAGVPAGVQARPAAPLSLTRGVISSKSVTIGGQTTTTVQLAGSKTDTPADVSNSYTPSEGDVVEVLIAPPRVLVIGTSSLAGGPWTVGEIVSSGETIDITNGTGPIVNLDASNLIARIQENVNVVAASGSGTVAIPDVTTATINLLTLTGNPTLAFPTAAAGKSFLLGLVQDATGSRTVTWPANVKWAAGTAPTLTTTAAKLDLFSFICIDGANWLGIVAGENF